MTALPPRREYQDQAIRQALQRGNLLLAMTMGSGKLQPMSEPVLTPTGWVMMGDLSPGSLVIGKDGKPTTVLAVFPHGEQPIYRVTFNDGSYTRVGGDHLWTVYLVQRRKHERSNCREMTTLELLESGVRQEGTGNRKWSIPMVGPVEFDSRDSLPVDPYVMGVLLGDACLRTSSVTLTSADPEIAVLVKDLLPEGTTLYQSDDITYPIVGEVRGKNTLLSLLRTLGLLGRTSRLKTVPSVYLTASVAQRLALLQGLMDTDGHATGVGGGAEFGTTSPFLRDAVVEITQSLGGTARVGKQREHANGPSWRVAVKLPPPFIPFRILRKAEAYVLPTKYPPKRLIASIDPDGFEASQCIKVSNSDGLYVTRSYIVTHNTRTAIDTVEKLAVQGDVTAGAVFVQNSTKFQWKREIEYWAPGATCLVIDGDKKTRTGLYRSAYKFRYTILNYEALIHDWELIQKFLPIDFVVADEVTNIKSFTAKKSKRLKALGRHTPYRFGMSGQPVENRPEELFSIMEFVDPTVLGKFHRFDRTFISRDHWGKPVSYRNLDLLNEHMSEAMFRRSREDIAAFLPELNTMETPVPLDAWSQKLYDEIRIDLIDLIDMAMAAGMGGFDLLAHYGRGDDNAASNQFKGLIMSRVTAMRLLCGHPALLLKSADDFDDPDVAGGAAYASELRAAGRLDKAPAHSNKLAALLDTVDEILSEDDMNKVVIFSGFKAMLSIISAELKTRKYRHTLLTGDVPPKLRDERIVKFNTDLSYRVFLSSDAGAYGVNLDAGTHLISYDLPWSAGSFAQRTARIDRTSSQHASIVVDSMFCARTIEERQYDMLVQKRKIAEAFVDGKFDAKGSLALDLSSLRDFLLK